MITKEQKQQIIATFGSKPNDTGSAEVQIALLDSRIKDLTEHFKANKKDFHSRRGLIAMVNQRKSLLEYLKRSNLESYKKLIEKLGLRK
ncbi:30S ribosomal protein S15 [Leptospira biflexa]|jgi:small subunit ribosomal protein S15|uniref:Small ribosomal subunit protein uS15 n=7 Tax=Leptospira TaxID=171 RepID=RS15_LEPBP|nr:MULTISPECIES: 30S ribosomal protein S15 [Leptospira]B0SH21.1 RecName: Full=Small ribosomal subunit protein uS15; AltName: Full=30S ribosomal protein S15 [Leptospira biflexa serovar Patoc strain 'Patoc 1 (Ames)']B0SQH7.1 RecName: Full=Small ribosomal subunit protein uS15; AltName: Full=30S ribosomal protein S15 [Leptospira biflexa serovar Patoc strain 'Patoc 1 (Paris)']PKA24978.1 30S ribosomal protein S15 [Leptospira sp. mixed culture ATI2-C-A1]ABZ93988.1 30S Ribosomal protein S15 [Leptospira